MNNLTLRQFLDYFHSTLDVDLRCFDMRDHTWKYFSTTKSSLYFMPGINESIVVSADITHDRLVISSTLFNKD